MIPRAAEKWWSLYEPLWSPTWVLGHLGQSLNGCIATHNGDSCFVTGPENLTHLHRIRALCDGVLVGFGTALRDDPQLTTRRVIGPNPVRIVLDLEARLPPHLKLFRDQQAITWRICGENVRVNALPMVEVVRVPTATALDYGQLVAQLRDLGIQRLFVEGGGVTVSRFLAARALTRLHIAIAPLIIGGGRLGLQLPPVDTLAAANRLRCRHFAMGDDVLFDCDLVGKRENIPVTDPQLGLVPP